MEDALRKELKELCQQIIDNSQSDELQDLLPRVQLIEEKLILLKYLQFRQSELKSHQLTQEQVRSEVSRKLDDELEQTLESAELQKQADTPEPLDPPMFSEEKAPVEEHHPEIRSEGPSKESTPFQSPEKETPLEATKADPEVERQTETTTEEEEMAAVHETPAAPRPAVTHAQPAVKSANRRSAAPIALGLNDRISFTNNLFDGSQQDLNRVISQLNTFESYREAEIFINQMVKPDYDWTDKSDYEERLFDLVKARFGEG